MQRGDRKNKRKEYVKKNTYTRYTYERKNTYRAHVSAANRILAKKGEGIKKRQKVEEGKGKNTVGEVVGLT